MKIIIRAIRQEDAQLISDAFARIGWHKPVSQYRRYLSEQRSKKRAVLVAWVGPTFVGYLTILWKSGYASFRRGRVPEIMDLNVLPQFRRSGIGTKLMDRAEAMIKRHSALAGIGVGLAPGYNTAQRMYVKRGYVPDGLGVTYDGKFVRDGQSVEVNDDLVFHLTKKLT